jgi:ubiquinone/menaquinone biosynthesis C-methylase UbiE
MNSPASSKLGSHDWQSGYIDKNLQERTAYLDAVAATDLMQEVAKVTLGLLALKSGDKVVDVGCGSGVLIPKFCEAVGSAGRVVGIDLAEAFVSEARARIEANGLSKIASVEIGDACALAQPTASFDAAHCERLLMHLVDPDRAIREMVRVVRPGGVVVAAEPDWPGIRFDHPDQEAFTKVFLRSLTAQSGDVGLTLYRRFGQAGLLNRRCLPVTVVLTDIAQSRTYGLKLESAVEALIAEGAMPAERLRAVVPALEAQSAAGNYCSIATMHLVAGTVPEPREA